VYYKTIFLKNAARFYSDTAELKPLGIFFFKTMAVYFLVKKWEMDIKAILRNYGERYAFKN
jgi:hypothetical protein